MNDNYFSDLPVSDRIVNGLNTGNACTAAAFRPTRHSVCAFAGLAQEIKNRQAEFMKHFNAGNAAGAADTYDPDGYFAPHGRDPVKGRAGEQLGRLRLHVVLAGIESYFKQDMAEGVKSVQIITEEVNGSGDWAYERGSYHLQGSRGTESGA
jgi:ketosteroid isomerase-like protein